MKKYFAGFCCLLFFVNFATALTLDQQRQIYAQAVNLQKQGEWLQASQKSALIPQYPLNYLLEYQYLREHFSKNSSAAVQSFMNKYRQHKMSSDLQRDYLYYLGKNQYWREFIEFYPKLPNSVDLQCLYFQAKIAQGEADKIWTDLQKTWLTGNQLPNACDNVLQYAFAENKIAQPLIWQRFKLAYFKNQKPLMIYLITLMNKEKKESAKQLYQLNKDPAKLLSSSLFKSRKQPEQALLVTSIKRLARKDINSGLDAFSLYENKKLLSAAEKLTLKKYFIARILITGETNLFGWLDNELIALGDPQLIERRIRYAIKLDNWHDIEFWLSKLSLPLQKDRWVYWQARVLENKQQTAQANKLYQQIAAKRTYYGFLATQKIGTEYQFNAQMVSNESQRLHDLQPQLAHIEELYFQQYMKLLKREWRALLKGKEYAQQKQLGLYAKQKGWAHLSVVASISSKSWNALNIRFPKVNPALFAYNANKYQLDHTYIYAITRQESSFDEFANSPVGARGYMQLMPNTAKETARKIGLKNYKQKGQLTQGDINVQLGSAYFNMLLKRYQGNRVLATAAYNAGPNRVDRWQGNQKGRAEEGLTMDSWIETIPYKETRRYVKNVLAYNVIYQHLLEQPLEFLNEKERTARF